MQISCEKCSTTYELDARLIPPAGAPVQCTRCGHIFTALPDGTVRRDSSPPPGEERAFSEDLLPQPRTRIFGTAPVPPPPSNDGPVREGTLAFGQALSPPPSDDGPVREGTLVFGKTPASPSPDEGDSGPVREGTLAFGKLPPPELTSPGPRPGPAPIPRVTSTFGLPAAAPAKSAASGPHPAPPGPRAQVFGAASGARPAPELPPESARHKTNVFGAPAIGQVPAQAPTGQAGAPPVSTTQIFGAAAVAAAAAAAKSGSHPAVSASRPAAPSAPPAAPGAPAPSTTQLFGVKDVEAKLAQARANPVPPPARPAAPIAPMSMPWFEDGDGPPAAPTVKDLVPFRPPPAPPIDDELSLEAPSAPTITDGLFLASPPPQRPAEAPRSPAPPRHPEPMAPPAPPRGQHVPVALPPEGPPSLQLDLDAAEVGDGESQGSSRWMLAAVVLLALGAAAYFGVKAVSARRAAVPPQVQVGLESAFSLLRKDDSASQEKAVAQLTELAREQPKLLEVSADLALALAIRLDDTHVATQLLELESEVLGRRIEKLREERSPGDWENRVNAMSEQRDGLTAQLGPLRKQGSELETRLAQLFSVLPAEATEETPLREELALLRARALYAGVRGTEEVTAATERYRIRGGRDGWDAIALGEYALNARVTPETLERAHSHLDGLVSSDSSFLRAYMLSARISLLQKKEGPASDTLEATMALNPAHDLAPKLLSWIKQAGRSEAATP